MLLQDRPLLQWLKEVGVYLNELLRLEGRGAYTAEICSCGQKDAFAIYRCEDCSDVRLYCRTCIVSSHRAHPVHRIKRWRDGHFSPVTLKSLGLRVQLGHQPGESCICPQQAWGDDFVLMDIFGIHEVGVDFCGCEDALPSHVQLLRARWFPATSVNPKTAATFRLLESFHQLSIQAKVSAFEYYSSLARRTDNTGTRTPKDRYPSFLTITREWRHLKLMKRGGRGNDPDGLAGTREGSCAVECPACPLPGKNLPDGWQDAPESKSWLYCLFLAMDANFRLRRKNVSSDDVDPDLNKGSAYIVEEQAYKAHLTAFDKLPMTTSNHCNNHDAVNLATLKGAVHLASTGVVSVDCARHEMKRPCSTGDLQKGERSVNSDYVLRSSLHQNAPNKVKVSYDVACIYSKNFLARFAKYGWDEPTQEFTWAIPKFHINAHREQCLADYNLRYLRGCGCSDCEGVERLWSRSNGAAAVTKEMGPGSRRDYVDDIFGGQNWNKVTSLPSRLLNAIKKAVPERNAQAASFRQYDKALPASSTAVWKEVVEAWEADSSNPNPFFIKRPSITQAAIKKQMAAEDAAALKAGTASVLHEKCSASGIVISGIELEEHQRRLKVDASALGQHATDIQRAKILERQNLLRRRIDSWVQVQQLYMPGVAAQRARFLAANEDASLAYNMPLLLPSAATTLSDRPLLDLEWRLRYAQAFDALGDLRGHLEVRAHLYKFKDRFARGQRANTRSHTIIKTVDAKIDGDAERYRAAYGALKALAVPLVKTDWQSRLQPLLQADIRHVTEAEDGESEGRRKMSWIWKATASPDPPDAPATVQHTLRVEWCKSRARAMRWSEEVELLQEEMRRTMAYHQWAAAHWSSLIDQTFVEQPDYREGANAYARRHAAMRESMRAYCEKSWRYVKMWVCLGTNDDDTPIPDLESLAPSEEGADADASSANDHAEAP
ncbi:hypothetical protein K466DRAFT_488291 [Polyporus arcularius HHB13444]|uniref:CxC2-like cysteine cluster KDZ transposase-associated domain-containing protein n=1 Tax=Polyporus arcularius HHB13444 TaxID=1314778 RepID=A0A5C3PRK2_9APHY|nr:hypothetical protein K466DRAFT_488291 [Polyporus arcularius HHB13444]